VHLFSFISEDFQRMRHDTFLGYPKPVLAVENGRLAVQNVPVPSPSAAGTVLTRFASVAGNLRLAMLYDMVVRLPQASRITGVRDGREADPLRDVVEKVFQSLHDLAEESNAALVLVYLPRELDYRQSAPLPWRQFSHDAAARLRIPFVDLTTELKALPSNEVETLFIGGGVVGFAKSGGHYSERGNRFMAESLIRRLRAVEAVSEKLSRVGAADRRASDRE
jgi:hypothetical protein